MDYDRVGVSGVPEDVEVGNDGIGDSFKNQYNWHSIVEDTENSDDGVTVVVDFAIVDTTDGVLADDLIYLFSPSSPQSNLPPGIIAAYSG